MSIQQISDLDNGMAKFRSDLLVRVLMKESQKYRKYAEERQKIYGRTGFKKNSPDTLGVQCLGMAAPTSLIRR